LRKMQRWRAGLFPFENAPVPSIGPGEVVLVRVRHGFDFAGRNFAYIRVGTVGRRGEIKPPVTLGQRILRSLWSEPAKK